MPEPIKIPNDQFQQALASGDAVLYREIERTLGACLFKASENLDWLYVNMHPYFFITMKEEIEAIVSLAVSLPGIIKQRKITLTDQEEKLIVARPDIPGSVYDTLKSLQEREISYAEMVHSYGPIPGSDRELEVHKFEFNRKNHKEIASAGRVRINKAIKKAIFDEIKLHYPEFNFTEFDKILRLLWLNNENYICISPPKRVARTLSLFQQAKSHDGLYLDVEETAQGPQYKESRLLFSVGNPPQKGFMTQISEVFRRLGIGVRRSYCLHISTEVHPYFMGSFYVTAHGGGLVEKGSDLFGKLQRELYNTQILSVEHGTYRNFVTKGVMTGEDASLTNALISFCHTSLAHSQPDRFDLETVRNAFQSDPEMTVKIIDVFKKKFDPDMQTRKESYEKALDETLKDLRDYNTGWKYLDEIRRTVFRTCVTFIRHTLKTNFFVPEKHALAFRLDPQYLSELGPECAEDLPRETPFRITFFYGRRGVGYHIGFSDIARGGWRTIICKSKDEYITNSNTLFREVFVLAATQHLKNKDIYEGGSKLVTILDTEGFDSPDDITQLLYKVQYGFINAFLDIFVTKDGNAKNPRVIDYYGEDEAIELGPDENMHDNMIEFIARQAVKRGYLLGIGIMSSKRIGINHKEYGVTSRGVVKFAETAMNEIGLDITRDSFSVKFTGGPNGDVAGNCMKLLLARCPKVNIVSLVDGTAGLYDPEGVDRDALSGLVLRNDLDGFNPDALHPGGFILFRQTRSQNGLRALHRKVARTGKGLEESLITVDEFQRELEKLIFNVSADMFLPCGGRPETIDHNNWDKLFKDDGTPAVRIIVEGANSFITPEAREEIQKRGVVVLRDASANKCGVISSSYEILANLIMTEKQFLSHKDTYVHDVLDILERRAKEEADLIFKRYREKEGKVPYTDISRAISTEINEHYARMFIFFQTRPELAGQPLFERIILNHLPALIRDSPKFKKRIKEFPPKIKYAILACEIASHLVYHGGWEMDFENRLIGYVKTEFA